MECLVTDSNKEELDHLKALIEQQIVFEGDVSNQAKIAREKTPFPDPQTECKPPRFIL